LAWKRRTKELTTDKIRRIIRELAFLGTAQICFTGGEPFLRQDLDKIINFIRERNILIEITSNGSSVREKISRIKNINILCLSLDGPERVHDCIRGRGSHKRVLEAAEVARGEEIKVYFITVISRTNLHCIDSLLKIARRFKTPCSFRPATALLYSSNLKNPFAPPVREYRRVIRQLIREKERGNEFIANSREGLRYLLRWPGSSKIPCISGRTFFHIEPDGKIYPCIWGRDIETLPHRDCLKAGVRQAIEELPRSECEGCWNGVLFEINYRLFKLKDYDSAY
jgi:MoaA/NifB/PqqE/SkfB family radical SAM enzyme